MSIPPADRTSSPAVNNNNSNGSSTSHGRGGAGNMKGPGNSNVKVEAGDLKTPTIKSATYTTGRGGTGNMATNDPNNPQTARAAQDVEAPAHHDRAPKGTFHWGRGGEGNQMTVGKPSIFKTLVGKASGSSSEKNGESSEDSSSKERPVQHGRSTSKGAPPARVEEQVEKKYKEKGDVFEDEDAGGLEKPPPAVLATAHGEKPEQMAGNKAGGAEGQGQKVRRSSFKEAVQKGKEKLGLGSAGAGGGKGEKVDEKDENAMED